MNITTMRNTKVYSITMLPDMAKVAERLAKKENRTMSELMREAPRRYQQPPTVDVYEFIRRLAPPPPELLAIREDAKRKGTDKLTTAQINREVAAVRRQHDKKKTSKRGK